jgi:hypothetical protein
MEFSAWRLLISKAAGYGVYAWEHGGITLLVPNVDLDDLVVENTLGIWDIEPEDVIVVLLAHCDYEGCIYPNHLIPLADRLEGLTDELENFSEHKAGTDQQTGEYDITTNFIKGLRDAAERDVAVTFLCEGM